MKIEIVSLGLILFSVLIIVLGIVKVHTYPGKIAVRRNHPQKDAIEVTAYLGLLVFPLWMFALIWAYSGSVLGSTYLPSGTDLGKGIVKKEPYPGEEIDKNGNSPPDVEGK